MVTAIFCAAAWFLAPKGENQTYVFPFPSLLYTRPVIIAGDSSDAPRRVHGTYTHVYIEDWNLADMTLIVSGARLLFSPPPPCTSCGRSHSSHSCTRSSRPYGTTCARSTTKGKLPKVYIDPPTDRPTLEERAGACTSVLGAVVGIVEGSEKGGGRYSMGEYSMGI